MITRLFYLLLLPFVSCSTPSSESLDLDLRSMSWQEINGRDEGLAPFTRNPIYRVRVPAAWEREDPDPQESIVDSKLPICSFFIHGENNEQVRITIHNFPTTTFNDRIPAGAQVQRWKRQLSAIAPESIRETPQAHGGFSGLYLRATGIMDGEPTTMLAWSMLMEPELYRSLEALDGNEEELRYFRQMRADYTIKATGKPEVIELYLLTIEAFARSFELIQAIPVFE